MTLPVIKTFEDFQNTSSLMTKTLLSKENLERKLNPERKLSHKQTFEQPSIVLVNEENGLKKSNIIYSPKKKPNA